MVVKLSNDEVYVYDFKTIGSYPYKLKFGRIANRESNPSIHQELQLSTYAYAIKKEFGRCDGIYLIYYNKDTSMMKTIEVDMSYMDDAVNFWTSINQIHANPISNNYLPPFQDNVSPVREWECKYCKFKDYCESQF